MAGLQVYGQDRKANDCTDTLQTNDPLSLAIVIAPENAIIADYNTGGVHKKAAMASSNFFSKTASTALNPRLSAE